MVDSDIEQQLEVALVERPHIEQAKGVLVALRGETPEEAFVELSHVSRDNAVRVDELADALVNAVAGRAPDDPGTGRVLLLAWGPLLRRPVKRSLGRAEHGPRSYDRALALYRRARLSRFLVGAPRPGA